MSTTAEMLERELAQHDDAETSLGLFYEPSTLGDVMLAASVAQKLGQVPEIRLVSNSADEPHAIELFVKDIPSMARSLARSIAQNGAEKQSDRDNDPRWKAVVDNTPVTFDGRAYRWGRLSQNEKMLVEINEYGVLVGRSPF